MDKMVWEKRDIEVTRLVEHHYPDAKLLVDGNDGYDLEGILRFVEGVSDCGLYWIEEASEETEQGLGILEEALQKHLPGTLIVDGDARPPTRLQDPPGLFGKWRADLLEELYECYGKSLIDVLLMDIGATGFTAWRNVIPKLQDLGVWGSPQAWSEPYKTYYAAQVGCGLGRVSIVEGGPGVVEGVDDSGYLLEAGVLALPDSPGFGMELI